MSVTGRQSPRAPDASDIAGRLREAGFVRLVGAASGDAVAAAGVLGRSLAALDRPFQVSVAPLVADVTRTTDADLTVALGREDASADLSVPGLARPASETATTVARELGCDVTTVLPLALAGITASQTRGQYGRVVDGPVVEHARETGLERRPGVAVPTADLADGLAHSTLVHAPVSGDADAAADLLAEAGLPADAGDLGEDARRRLASLVALSTVGDDDVPPRGGRAVERALRPFPGGPVRTVGGYADVLDAVARERPGTGVAAALGHDVLGDAVDAWREHAARAHEALRTADTGRYDGLFVVRADGDTPVGTVARLAHAYRSPEPVTLVATDGRAAVVADDPLEGSVRTAAESIDGTGEATGTSGRARFEGPAAAFVTAYREVQG